MLNRRMLLGAALALASGVKAKAARMMSAGTPAEAAAQIAALGSRIHFKGSDDYEAIREWGIFSAKSPSVSPRPLFWPNPSMTLSPA
jgi:hypothetical protein